MFILAFVALFVPYSVSETRLQAKPKVYRLQDFLGKNEEWVEKRFQRPPDPIQWRLSPPRPRHHNLRFVSAQVLYKDPTRDPGVLQVTYVGPENSKPIVTQIGWTTLANNGWTQNQAASDVGMDLKQFKLINDPNELDPSSKVFALKRNPRVRGILVNANGSLRFRFELLTP